MELPDKRPLLRVTLDEFSKVWPIYVMCREIEAQFNEVEASYRKLSSTWLLASLGAIGFLLFQLEDPTTPGDIRRLIHPYLLVAGVGLVSSIGVGVIWVLDLWVYHRLLNAVFFVGIKLESEYHWLPPTRHAMMLSQEGVGVEPKTVIFISARRDFHYVCLSPLLSSM